MNVGIMESREYQLHISEVASKANTLVVLPSSASYRLQQSLYEIHLQSLNGSDTC
jgi:hypothetical protein